MDLQEYFDVELPINRLSFFLRTLILGVLFALFTLFEGSSYFAALGHVAKQTILFFSGMAYSLAYLSALMKRSQDVDRRGYVVWGTYLLYVAVSIVGIYFPEYKPAIRYDDSFLGLGILVGIQYLYLLIVPGRY